MRVTVMKQARLYSCFPYASSCLLLAHILRSLQRVTLDTRFRFSSTTIEGNAKSLAHCRHWCAATVAQDGPTRELRSQDSDRDSRASHSNINIETHGKYLSISGNFKCSENHDKGRDAVQERSYGKFSRTRLTVRFIV
ncbi:hypothetical protein F4604DRAFT_1265389 [Suillus subluteus]|nr:hypothetical protein F4604DRAFT_1265389 [Suillus subluteus]